MKKLVLCIVFVLLLGFCLDGKNDIYPKCGRTVFDRIIPVEAKEVVFEIIKVDWSDFVGSKEISPDRYILVGKVYVFANSAMTPGVSCYILTPDQYEVYLSGETPQWAVFWQIKNRDMSIRTEALTLGQKYYFILDNKHTKMTDKRVLVYLLALPIWGEEG